MHQIQKYVGIYEKHTPNSKSNLPRFICMSHYADYHYNNLHNEIINKDFFDTGVKWMQEYTKSTINSIDSRDVYILFYKIFGEAAFFDFLLKESILYTNNVHLGEVFYSASIIDYIKENPYLDWVYDIYSNRQLDSVGYAYINCRLRIIEIMKDKKELGLYQDYLFLNKFKIMHNRIRKAICGKVSEPQNFDINSYIYTLFYDFRQEICSLGIDCDSTFTWLLNPTTYPLPMNYSTLEELGSIFIRTQLVPNMSKLTRRKKNQTLLIIIINLFSIGVVYHIKAIL